MDENDIYNVVAGIYDSIDTLGHDKKNELDLDFAASVTAVPYHKLCIACIHSLDVALGALAYDSGYSSICHITDLSCQHTSKSVVSTLVTTSREDQFLSAAS